VAFPAQFSDWLNVFSAGSGTITIKDHATGATLLTEKIPLTPGPVRMRSIVSVRSNTALDPAVIYPSPRKIDPDAVLRDRYLFSSSLLSDSLLQMDDGGLNDSWWWS